MPQSKLALSVTSSTSSPQTIEQLQQKLERLQSAYESQTQALQHERKKRTILEHYLHEYGAVNQSAITSTETSVHAFAADYTLYYKDIIENHLDLICRFLPDGTITFANLAFLRFFNLPAEKVLGRKYQSLILPEDRANLDAYLLFLSQKYPVGDVEHRVIVERDETTSPQICWLQWRSRALFADEGEIREFQAVGRDITKQKNDDLVHKIRFNYLRQTFDTQTSELKQATDKLVESQQQQQHTALERHLYQQAIESSSDMVAMLNTQGKILFANRTFKETYQMNPAGSAHGLYLIDFIPTGQRDEWVDIFGKALKGKPLHVDIEQDEQIFNFALSPLKKNDQALYIVVFARDVTMRKYTEVAFQQSNDELRRMILELGALNHISQVIATKELTAALPDVARRIRSLFDFYSTTFVLYNRDHQLLHVLADVRKNQQGKTRFDGRQIKLSTIGISEEEMIQTQTKTIMMGELTSSPIVKYFFKIITVSKVSHVTFVPLILRKKVIGYIIVTVRDEAQQRQMQISSVEMIANHIAIYIDNARLFHQEQKQRQLLEKQNGELDAFTRMVAHDLKNPLHSMVGFSDMLVQYKDHFDEAEKDDMLSRITAGARNMSKTIDELLLLAQIGRFAIKPMPVKTSQLIEQALEVTAHLQKEYEGEIIMPERWPEIQSHGPWLQEVWNNYLSNGIKYGGRPYRVELGATKLADDVIRFWVKDNGAGIEQKNLNKLFVEFQRLPETKTLPGTGLGLAIVKRIVEHLGGRVGVQSQPNHGSTFYFDLPYQAPEIPAG